MKLPPAALTAPSLCPRCDSPAIMTDYCIACTLPLRRCGSCQGVAGPFDRYCGFCSYELVRGVRRPAVWRLWLLAALIPLVAGIAFGVSPYSYGLSHGVTALVGYGGFASPTPKPAPLDAVLNLGYTAPKDWTAGDQGQLLVLTRWQPDATRVAAAQGNLLSASLQSSTIVVSRPVLKVPVDTSDPQALLAFDVAQLLQSPPSGVKIEPARQISGLTVGGRRAAEAIMKVTNANGSVWYFERAYVDDNGRPVRADVLSPAVEWAAGDSQRAEAVIRSLR
jgi:hypothetical protein